MKSVAFNKTSVWISSAIVVLFFIVLAIQFQAFYLALAPFAVLILTYFIFNIEWSFDLLLLSIPISINLGSETSLNFDFPDEILMILNSFLALFYMIKNKAYFDKSFFKHPLVILILLSFLWTLLSALFSYDFFLSIKFVFKKMWYLLPFFFFAYPYFSDKKNQVKGFQLLFIPFLFILFFVLYNYSKLGFKFEEVHEPIQPFFVNHVIYGAMISSFFPLIVAAYFLSKKLSIQKLVVFVGILLFLFCIYFSYSRAAWAATFFAGMVYVLVRLKIMHFAILGFYFLIITSLFYVSKNNTYISLRPNLDRTYMHDNLQDHIIATFKGEDISSAERFHRWIAALNMWKKHPLFGYGPNTFYEHYKPYLNNLFKTWVSRNPERSTTHNYFLFMLTEQGFPAMLLYALLIYFIFYSGQKCYHRLADKREKIILIAVLGMLGAVFVNNFFSELLEQDKLGSLFFIGISIILGFEMKRLKTKKNQLT